MKNFTRFLLFIGSYLALLWSSRLHAQTMQFNVADPVTRQMKERLRQTLRENKDQIQFIQNHGQSDLPASVIAYFTTGNETVFIEKDRLRIVITEGLKPVSVNSLNQHHYNSFQIQFAGAQNLDHIEWNDPRSTLRSYINAGNSRMINSRAYGEIILKQVYPGIDLRFYSRGKGHLEFDWIIMPGASYQQIRMQFTGEQKLGLNKEGALTVSLAMGDFHLRLPESYYVTPDGKQPANIQFQLLAKGQVGFKSSHWMSMAYPLVIDPDLLWGTFFDGADPGFDEYLYAIHFDTAQHLLYCAGAANMQVSSVYAAALATAYDSVFSASTDALIYSLSANGEIINHITYLGGAGEDVATGISVADSLVYVCGYTNSTDLPISKGPDSSAVQAFDSVYHGANDGFVAVFNAALDSLRYCSYLGGDGNDRALTIRALPGKSFYISLSVKDTLPLADPAYIVNASDTVYEGVSEAYIARFDSFNILRFGTYIGGNSDDLVNDFQLLSNGCIVFTGYTKQITEVNGFLPNGSGTDVLFGRLKIPDSGAVQFELLDKYGGSGSDQGWGLLNLGDSVSIIVGQTSSANFPLGSAIPFQSVKNAGIDGFIAKIYNDGNTDHKASFVGGNDDDILVSVRPVVVNNRVAILGFGSTRSDDLATRNFNAGSFFSGSNSGGLDMMFVISDLDMSHKYYLSYIGGSNNDYLGITGAPVGSNHLYYEPMDSALYVGTTTHSNQSTHLPLFVGRGPADYMNLGVPVFDQTKNNGANDTHVIIAISTKSLFFLLPVQWEDIQLQKLPDCSRRLSWKAIHEEVVDRYWIERSPDGLNFSKISESLNPFSSNQYIDTCTSLNTSFLYYRIASIDLNGKLAYSAVKRSAACNSFGSFKILPTIVKDHISIYQNGPGTGEEQRVLLSGLNGRIIQQDRIRSGNPEQQIFIRPGLAGGIYLLQVMNMDGEVIFNQKLLIMQQ